MMMKDIKNLMSVSACARKKIFQKSFTSKKRQRELPKKISILE